MIRCSVEIVLTLACSFFALRVLFQAIGSKRFFLKGHQELNLVLLDLTWSSKHVGQRSDFLNLALMNVHSLSVWKSSLFLVGGVVVVQLTAP